MRLLRAAGGVADLYDASARTQLRVGIPPDADPQDLLLLDDLLGIADPEVALPAIDPDARRRRLTVLIIPCGWRAPHRRCLSSKTRTGSMRSASRCWPTSSP